ncbi:MAG TPA: hypothetical protein VF509_00175 [Sphingobium sp.]
MGHFAQRYIGVIDDPVFQQPIGLRRRLALKHIDISAYDICFMNKRQFLFAPPRQLCCRSLWLDPGSDALRSNPKRDICRDRALPAHKPGREIILQRHFGKRIFNEIGGSGDAAAHLCTIDEFARDPGADRAVRARKQACSLRGSHNRFMSLGQMILVPRRHRELLCVKQMCQFVKYARCDRDRAGEAHTCAARQRAR